MTSENKVVWKYDQKLDAFVLPSVSVGNGIVGSLSLGILSNGSYRLSIVGSDGLVEVFTNGEPRSLVANDNNPLAYLYVLAMKQVLNEETFMERFGCILCMLEEGSFPSEEQ